MKVLFGIQKFKKLGNPVIALGVFDGLHRGHRNILEEAVAKARRIKGRSVVITFWPHPQKEESLYSLEHRLGLFSRMGVDVCIVINFSKAFSGISAKDFVTDILVDKIGARFIYVGRNFRFGRHAKGDLALLRRLSGSYNFKVRSFHVVTAKGKPISSTDIRQLIKKGELIAAQRLLTRPVSILGSVIRGNFLGRKLGFPTANINPHHEVIPAPGIYAVRVIYAAKIYRGVCYIGTRPTFTRRQVKYKTHIEVHLFDFKKNIYGKYLEIQFIKKIRQDKKFKSPAALSAQMHKDANFARRILSAPLTPTTIYSPGKP